MRETSVSPRNHDEGGGQLVGADGRGLVLRDLSIRADACAGLARVVVEQRFTNPYAEALAVTYQLPLPADGLVAGRTPFSCRARSAARRPRAR